MPTPEILIGGDHGKLGDGSPVALHSPESSDACATVAEIQAEIDLLRGTRCPTCRMPWPRINIRGNIIVGGVPAVMLRCSGAILAPVMEPDPANPGKKIQVTKPCNHQWFVRKPGITVERARKMEAEFKRGQAEKSKAGSPSSRKPPDKSSS